MSVLKKPSVAIIITFVLTLFSVFYMVALGEQENEFVEQNIILEQEYIEGYIDVPEQDGFIQEMPESQDLVDTWLWRGSPYYVFEADGSGIMAGASISWIASGGVLSICSTPEVCGISCPAPAEWYYTIDGNQLTLTSRIFAIMTYTYTRSN